MSARQAMAESPVADENLAYVVCTMTRTGSSLLCDALSRTGTAGKPAEYFDIHKGNQDFWRRQLNIEDESQYLDKVLEAGTTPNGMFGLKLMWHQLPAMMKAFGAPEAGIDIDKVLASRFATRKYIWLRRRNKVAQAISNYRAIKSSIWRVGPKLPKKANRAPELDFDLEAIDHQVRLVEHFERQWQTWFQLSKQQALVLVYEDFSLRYEQTIRGVCDYLGVDSAGMSIPEPRFERQADEASLEWEARYRKLKGLPDDVGAQAVVPQQVAVLKSAPSQASAAGPPRLVAYDIGSAQKIPLSPAPNTRAWMDATPMRFANRCLPLLIANQHGWMMTCPNGFEAIWDGGDHASAITVREPDGVKGNFVQSHFGHGILTFTGNYLFRTPPGVNLHVRGPANLPKDGLFALEGIVETDWTEATFTMNWKFTRPNHPVVFEAGEPFAMFSPVRRGDIEAYRPVIEPLAANPGLEAGYQAWSASRSNFNKDLQVPESEARKAGWQRHYTRGETVTRARTESHQTKLSLQEFVDKRK